MKKTLLIILYCTMIFLQVGVYKLIASLPSFKPQLNLLNFCVFVVIYALIYNKIIEVKKLIK